MEHLKDINNITKYLDEYQKKQLAIILISQTLTKKSLNDVIKLIK